MHTSSTCLAFLASRAILAYESNFAFTNGLVNASLDVTGFLSCFLCGIKT